MDRGRGGCRGQADGDEEGRRGHAVAHAQGAVDELGAESGKGNKEESGHKYYSY